MSRARQDAYAARSHAAAAATREAGGFDAEVVPVAGVHRDERPRPGLTVERLARLRPAFRAAEQGGTVTAGNSCGVNDGAAAVTLVDAETYRRARTCRVCGSLATATAGVRPVPARSRPGAGRRGQALCTGRPRGWPTSTWSSSTRRSPARCSPAATRSASTPSGSAPRAARSRWVTRGARPARCCVVRLFCQLVRSRPGGRYGLAAVAAGRRPGRGGGGRAVPRDRGRPGSATPTATGRRVLRDVDVPVAEQRVGVVGANGSGKSTFARMLNGLVLPTRGRVTLDGLDTRSDGPRDPPPGGLLLHRPRRPDRDADRRRGRRLRAATAGADEGRDPGPGARALESLRARAATRTIPAHLLSGGQKQLLALASVLVTEPGAAGAWTSPPPCSTCATRAGVPAGGRAATSRCCW